MIRYNVTHTVVADSAELAGSIAAVMHAPSHLTEDEGVSHYNTSVTRIDDDLEDATADRIAALIDYLGQPAALEALEAAVAERR